MSGLHIVLLEVNNDVTDAYSVLKATNQDTSTFRTAENN